MFRKVWGIGWAVSGSLRKPQIHRQLHIPESTGVPHIFDIVSLGVVVVPDVKTEEQDPGGSYVAIGQRKV